MESNVELPFLSSLFHFSVADSLTSDRMFLLFFHLNPSGSPYRIPNSSTFDSAYNQMVSSSGCQNSTNSFKCLRALPTSDFNTAMNAVSVIGALSFTPGVDGDFIPDYPDSMVLQGRYNRDVSIINGDQTDEGTFLTLKPLQNVTDEAGFDDYLRVNIPNLKESDYSKLKELYPSDPTQGSPYKTGNLYNITGQNKRLASFYGDLTFQYARRLLINTVYKTNPKVFSYIHGTFAKTPLLGCYHIIELVNTCESHCSNST